jgi:hypothetical protein
MAGKGRFRAGGSVLKRYKMPQGGKAFLGKSGCRLGQMDTGGVIRSCHSCVILAQLPPTSENKAALPFEVVIGIKVAGFEYNAVAAGNK